MMTRLEDATSDRIGRHQKLALNTTGKESCNMLRHGYVLYFSVISMFILYCIYVGEIL